MRSLRNQRDNRQLDIQQGEDLIRMNTPVVHTNSLNPGINNHVIPTHDYQQEILNTAMMEPRQFSRNSRINAEDQEWFGRRTPHTNMSESILKQQMNLMRDIFQMVSVQNAHMREQINKKKTDYE